MKQTIFAMMLTFVCMGSAWADRVGVSINIGRPNFFGQIDVGDLPPPPVVREEPIIIRHPRHHVLQEPVYLRVPSSHQRNWRRYCARYNACGRPVYFVRDDWYLNEYVPRYRERHHDDEHHHDRDEHHHDDRH